MGARAPGRGGACPGAAPVRVAVLVNERLGIIRRVERHTLHPHLPTGLRLVSASIADTASFCPWPSDATATGCTWWDAASARDAAIGEAVERYCGNLVPSGLRRASYAELAAAGEPALDPAELALYSEAQYRTPGFPFVPFTHDLPVRWAQGHDLATGERALVPASLVYVTYHEASPTAAEPRTNATAYAGVAAGTSRERAEYAALLELFERDAVALGWLGGARLPRIHVHGPLAALLPGPKGALETTLYQFPSEFSVPVIGALIRDEVTGIVAMGTACRIDPAQAALKALAEAAQLHIVSYALDDPTSALARLGTASGPLKPWRADRRYRDAYRSDWRDMTTLACQVQLYLDPAMRAPLDDRLAGGPEVALDATAGNAPSSSGGCVRLLARRGLRAIAIDVTTPDVRSQGWLVVRVVVPGLYSNAPAAFPLLGGSRIADSLSRAALCLLPLPHG